ncbi:MAG: hypothetical protein U0905_13110 [Pirellulales bacterium]
MDKPVDPLSVTCSSCQGKILVKNERLAGQIVPCPRCKNPIAIPSQRKVLFTPPPGMVADSVSITKSVDDDWANDLDQALAAHREEQTGQAQLSSSQVIEKTLVDPPNAWKVDEEEEFRLEPFGGTTTANDVAPPLWKSPPGCFVANREDH